jgi:RNA polymerase sigma-70 factor (family 1)
VARDKDLFNTVYEKLYLPVYYFACRFVDKEDAEDITANSFLKLWQSNVDYSILPKAKNWLQVCARNACLLLIRDQKKRVSDHKNLLYLFSERDESDQEYLIREELLDRLNLEIEKLPPQRQRVFKMAYLEGKRSKQIAAVLHISENTISKHRVKALKFLRLALKDFT